MSPTTVAGLETVAWGMRGIRGIESRVAEAQAFLLSLAAEYDGGLIELRAFPADPSVNGIVRRWCLPEESTRLARFCIRLAATHDVYVGVQPRTRKAGRAVDVAAVAGVYADIDCGEGKPLADKAQANQRVQRLIDAGLSPTMLVDSGRGYHAYWLLRELLSCQDWHCCCLVIRALAAALAGDTAVADLPRILRVPGTLNHKHPADPQPVRLLSLDASRRFVIDDFDILPPPPSPGAGPRPESTSQRARPRGLIVEAMRAKGWAFVEKHNQGGAVLAYILDQPCPFCPGPPTQADPPRRRTAHVGPLSGSVRCKRARCRAGVLATGVLQHGEPVGIPFRAWSPLPVAAPISSNAPAMRRADIRVLGAVPDRVRDRLGLRRDRLGKSGL